MKVNFTHFYFVAFFLLATFSKAQTLKGRVFEVNEKSDTTVLPGANLYWLGTKTGTSTDVDGIYKLKRVEGKNRLVISFIGLQNDTLLIDSLKAFANFYLSNANTLQEVEVVYRDPSSSFSFLNPIKIETLTQGELAKAACCNLSESFETNPSVDVNYADAITGTKQIQMLGLAGQYAMITKENMPFLRGLGSIYGLSFIPGTWIQSIQLGKGAGSVINGYESFTGQINTELQKPNKSEHLYFNAYVNENGRNEYNLNLGSKLNKAWSAGLLSHFSLNPLEQDHNGDGFLDIPSGRQYNIMPRLNYETKKGFEGQLGGSYVLDERNGGQALSSHEHSTTQTSNPYLIGINSEKLDLFAKNGFVFRKKIETSMGLQLSYLKHRQDNFYGPNNYKGDQQTFYANYIFQGILGNSDHKFRTGASYIWDSIAETYRGFRFKRAESVPGVFYEYTYVYMTKFNVVAGIRGDYHNYYGFFVTPRLHMRYAFNNEKSVVRVSGGRALRTANVLAENSAFMASSRDFILSPSNLRMPYGLDAEVAWNYGINYLQKFKLNYRDAQFVVDIYRTDFKNQVVVDIDKDPQQVLFYNLKGRSFSNTVQTEFSWEIRKRLDMRIAYRYIDTRTQYSDALLPKYLLGKHRVFLNLSYLTKNKHWQFDHTTQWNGSKRLPNTSANPTEYTRANSSPAYFILNGQITYKTGYKHQFDIYLGVENALNLRQSNPIVSANNPFGKYFDASMIWGPIYGRMLYAGIRYKIKRTEN